MHHVTRTTAGFPGTPDTLRFDLSFTEDELNVLTSALALAARQPHYRADARHFLEDLVGLLTFEDASETDRRHAERDG